MESIVKSLEKQIEELEEAIRKLQRENNYLKVQLRKNKKPNIRELR